MGGGDRVGAIHNELPATAHMKLMHRLLKLWPRNLSGAQSTVVEEVALAPIHNELPAAAHKKPMHRLLKYWPRNRPGVSEHSGRSDIVGSHPQ